MNRVLWVVQVLLALLFLFGGTMKFLMPVEEMTAAMPQMPAEFLYFIGVCECLGAIGLIVPQLTGILPQLTPIAAMGLIVIMIGAVTITVMTQPVSLAILPFVAGVLLCVVAYGRLRTYAAVRHAQRA